MDMFAEYKHTLRRLRGRILGWGIGLSLYSVLMVAIYPDIQRIDMSVMLEYYPEEMLAFFGDALETFNTPSGYMETYFFNYMPVILGIFVVGACAGLLTNDEENGVLDLLMAHPVSRSSLFWGRVFGFATALAIILAAAYLSWSIPAGGMGMELTLLEFLRPYLPLFAALLLFGFFALLLSMVLPASRVAGMVVGGLLVANYLSVGLANLNDDLANIVKYTPLHFYQGGKAVEGIDWAWFAGLLGAALVMALLAWWRFERRDIRVGGEGGWKILGFERLRRRRKIEADAGT
jgi:ABC-2 type transport system permease protein